MDNKKGKISKKDLETIFKSLEIPFNEGISSDKNKNAEARIVYWDYFWEPLVASGKEYATNVLYQVSFFSKISRHKKLLLLKKKLAEKEIFVAIEHEYNQKEQNWHSYFKVEVLEDLYEKFE